MPFKQYMPLRLHWCYEHDCRDQSIMQVNILSWVLTKRCVFNIDLNYWSYLFSNEEGEKILLLLFEDSDSSL